MYSLASGPMAERRVPGVEIRNRAVDPHVGGCVRPRRHLVAREFRGEFRAPHLRPAKEEALVAGITVKHGRLLASERGVVGVERDLDAADVLQRFVGEQLPFQMHSRQGLLARVECTGSLPSALELAGVGRGQPGIEPAVGVVTAARAEQRPDDLRSDGGAVGAVIDGIVCADVEEWRDEQRRRDFDRIARRIVGILRVIRGQGPFRPRHVARQLSELGMPRISRRTRHVAVKVAGFDPEARVGIEAVGITDQDLQCAELRPRRLFGLRAQQRGFGDPVDERGLHQASHLLRFGLGLRRAVALDVDGADRIRNRSFDEIDHVQIAVRTSLKSGERGRSKPAIGTVDLAIEARRVDVGGAERLLGAKRVERRFRVNRRDVMDDRRNIGHERGTNRDVRAAKKARPGEAGRGFLELRERGPVIGLRLIAQRFVRGADAGDLGLEPDDVGGAPFGIFPADQAQRLGDIIAIARAEVGEFRFGIIFGTRKDEAGLADIKRVLPRIAAVDVDGERKEVAAGRGPDIRLAKGARSLDRSHQPCELGAGGCRSDRAKLGL